MDEVAPDSEAGGARRIPASRRAAMGFVLLLVTWGLLELISHFGIVALEKRGVAVPGPCTFTFNKAQKQIIRDFLDGKQKFHQFSPTLGWTVKPNGRSEDGSCAANAAGVRASREFTPAVPEGIVRVSTFGDSFTFGEDVANSNTWQECAMQIDPGLEVLNFGVSAYGSDQALLRYLEERRTFRPDIVVLAFMSDDLNRHVSVFRPFVKTDTSSPFSKPRYILRDGVAELLPNPLRSGADYARLMENPRAGISQLGRNDFFFRTRFFGGPLAGLPTLRLIRSMRLASVPPEPPLAVTTDHVSHFNPDAEAYKVTMAIMKEFQSAALKDGSLPLVVLLPGKEDMKSFAAHGAASYSGLMKDLAAAGIRHLDASPGLLAAMKDHPDRTLWSRSLHYSAHANAIVARELVDYLKSSGLRDKRAIAAAIAESK